MKIVVQGPPRRNLASESQKPRKYPTITPIANTQKLTYPTSASIQSVPLVLSPSAFRQALSASIISQITQKNEPIHKHKPSVTEQLRLFRSPSK